MRRFGMVLFAALILSAAVTTLPVEAFATVDSYSASCSDFQASGTTDAPYVIFFVWDSVTSDVFLDEAVPTSGGSFNRRFSFPTQPTGRVLEYYVWGSPTPNSNDYDNESYFVVDLPCVPKSDEGSETGPPCGNLLDGRINDVQGVDCAAPVAIYDEDGAISIYAIDPTTGTGQLIFTTTHSSIEAEGLPTAANLVLYETTINGVRVIFSRLTTGELQVNAYYGEGKSYIVVWPMDNPDALYHLYS